MTTLILIVAIFCISIVTIYAIETRNKNYNEYIKKRNKGLDLEHTLIKIIKDGNLFHVQIKIEDREHLREEDTWKTLETFKDAQRAIEFLEEKRNELSKIKFKLGGQ